MKIYIEIYTIIFLAISFVWLMYYLLKTTKNDFFKQSKADLEICREKVRQTLLNLGRSQAYIKKSLEAFDFFVSNPERFDGATIVRDLFDVKHNGYKLEIASLKHDYFEIEKAGNRNLLKNWQGNYRYFKDLIKNGKPPMVSRLVGLMLVSIPYVMYNYFKSIKKQ